MRAAFDARVDGADTPDPPPFRGLDRLGRTPWSTSWRPAGCSWRTARAQAFADSPAKAWGELETGRLPSGALLDSNRLLLAAEFRSAQREAWISSPYLVPGPEALEGMRSNMRRGVRVSLLTNSLAATDEPVVHTGYRRYRDNMLRAGVQIFELHPQRAQRLLLGGVPEGTCDAACTPRPR